MHLLGLCQRAGKAVSGDFAVRANLSKGKAKVMIIATDTSEKIQREYIQLGKANNVPTILALTKQELGLALGKSSRAAVVVLDKNFAQGIVKLLDRSDV
nr:ribosomal L7Ae/L30e/S12e/Gadd45 family protein [Desulforamulus aquiferis]